MTTFKLIENPQDGEPVQFLGVYCLRWRQEWGEPTVAFVEDDEIKNKIEEIHRLAMLPADGSEPKEGDPDNPIDILFRIAELTK